MLVLFVLLLGTAKFVWASEFLNPTNMLFGYEMAFTCKFTSPISSSFLSTLWTLANALGLIFFLNSSEIICYCSLSSYKY